MGYIIGYKVGEKLEVVSVGENRPHEPYGRYNYNGTGGYDAANPAEILKYTSDLKEYEEAIRPITERFDHWTDDCESYGTLCIYYNEGGDIEVETDEYEDRLLESVARDLYDFVYLWDGGELKDVKLPNWKKREEVKNAEEAMKYLLSGLANGRCNKEDSETFAAEWGIPFSYEMWDRYDDMWKDVNPSWNSSSKWC